MNIQHEIGLAGMYWIGRSGVWDTRHTRDTGEHRGTRGTHDPPFLCSNKNMNLNRICKFRICFISMSNPSKLIQIRVPMVSYLLPPPPYTNLCWTIWWTNISNWFNKSGLVQELVQQNIILVQPFPVLVQPFYFGSTKSCSVFHFGSTNNKLWFNQSIWFNKRFNKSVVQ